MSIALRSRLMILGAAFLLSTGGAAIKFCQLTNWQIAGFRSGVAVFVVLAMSSDARRGWSLRALPVGVAYATMMILFVLANKLTTAANTVYLNAASPIYILLLGPWLLREPIRRTDYICLGLIAVGLGMLFTSRPAPVASAPDPALGNTLAILSGVALSLALVGLRWLGRDVGGGNNPAIAAVVMGNLLCFAICLPMAIPIAVPRVPDVLAILYLGAFQIGLPYVLLTKATRNLSALETSILMLLEPALSPIWAWYFQGEHPGAASLAGGAIILFASLGKSWFDARARRPISD